MALIQVQTPVVMFCRAGLHLANQALYSMLMHTRTGTCHSYGIVFSSSYLVCASSAFETLLNVDHHCRERGHTSTVVFLLKAAEGNNEA